MRKKVHVTIENRIRSTGVKWVGQKIWKHFNEILVHSFLFATTTRTTLNYPH